MPLELTSVCEAVYVGEGVWMRMCVGEGVWVRVCVGEGVCGRGLNAQQNIDLWISEIQMSDFLLHVYHCSWQLEFTNLSYGGC